MNKTELIAAVADKTGLSKKDAEAAITAFEVKHRAARVGRTPKTGDAIQIPASKAPVFQAGKALKDAVAQ